MTVLFMCLISVCVQAMVQSSNWNCYFLIDKMSEFEEAAWLSCSLAEYLLANTLQYIWVITGCETMSPVEFTIMLLNHGNKT